MSLENFFLQVFFSGSVDENGLGIETKLHKY